jgi:hypothetical protein
MKAGGGVHTVPNPTGRGWANKEDGVVRTRHRTKKAAVLRGRTIARREAVEHTIHGRDGCIKQKNSYGNDPCPPKDAE